MSLTTDKVQAFPTLEDGSDQSGKPLSFKQEGDAAAGGNYAGMLTGKDPSGNLQFLKINANNELVVDTESAEVACLTGTAKVTGGTSEQTILTITLQATTEYKKIGWIVSNFRQSEFRIAAVDDAAGSPVETELATILVGPGDYTDSGEIECLSFTSGSTGVQELQLLGTNKDVASDLRGTLAVSEIQ